MKLCIINVDIIEQMWNDDIIIDRGA